MRGPEFQRLRVRGRTETSDVPEVEESCFLIEFICGRSERVGSRMIPRLRTQVEGVTIEPSILRERS